MGPTGQLWLGARQNILGTRDDCWGLNARQHRSPYNVGQEGRENTNVLGVQDRVPSGFDLMITGDHDGYLSSFHPHLCKCSRSDSQNNMASPHQHVALGSGLDFTQAIE